MKSVYIDDHLSLHLIDDGKLIINQMKENNFKIMSVLPSKTQAFKAVLEDDGEFVLRFGNYDDMYMVVYHQPVNPITPLIMSETNKLLLEFLSSSAVVPEHQFNI